MTENRPRKTAAAPGGKPAASLLSVPVFKDQANRRRTIPSETAAPARQREAETQWQPEAEEAPTTKTGLRESGRSDGPEPPDLAGRGAAPAEVRASQVARSAPVADPPPRRTPSPPQPEAGGEREAPTKSQSSPEAQDIRRYWRRVGHGRHPDIEDLDAATIAAHWPNTLLIRVAPDGLVEIVRVYAPAADSADAHEVAPAHPFAGDRYAQLSSWVLELARQAAWDAAPLQTTETFTLGAGRKALTARVLPCGSRTDPADYVLLNIAESGGQGFQRAG